MRSSIEVLRKVPEHMSVYHELALVVMHKSDVLGGWRRAVRDAKAFNEQSFKLQWANPYTDLINSIEELDRSINDIIQLQDLIVFARRAVAVSGISHFDIESPTNAEWLFYGRQLGLPENELIELLSAVSTVNVQSVETLHSFDGNAVRKLGARGLHTKKQSAQAIVEIWLSGNVEIGEEERLRAALEEALARGDLTLDAYEAAVRGSFYQKLKFLGVVSRYSGKIMENLGSAFRSTSTNYQISAVKALSDVLEKHENAVLRVDHMIAIKITRGGKARTMIAIVPAAVDLALRSDPKLISHPERLMQLIEDGNSATPISSARRTLKGNERR